MSLRAFRSLETGEADDPHYSTLNKLAAALDMSVSELTGEKEPTTPHGPGPTRASQESRDAIGGKIAEEGGRFLSRLAESNHLAILEVDAQKQKDYTHLLALAARFAKQSRLLRAAFEEILREQETIGLSEKHKENLLAHLNDLDSVVDQTYIMAIKSASGREADVVELPVELRQHVERRQDDIQQARSSA